MDMPAELTLMSQGAQMQLGHEEQEQGQVLLQVDLGDLKETLIVLDVLQIQGQLGIGM